MSVKARLQEFRHLDEEDKKRKASPDQENTQRIKRIAKARDNYQELQDLNPILRQDQKIMFIGYNPGVQSSIQQHHYAHPSNLFWKLFNNSKLIFKVMGDKTDPFIQSVIRNGVSTVKAEHDTELINYGIGFTDLVLRCTKSADELTIQEKLANVPRLVQEFQYSGSTFLVFIGKGIWEVFVKHFANKYGISVKLTKDFFTWGKQEVHKGSYGELLAKIQGEVGNKCIYVFPNTSGLVATPKYPEKLALWKDLVNDI